MAEIPHNLPECMVFLMAKTYQRAHGKIKKRLKAYETNPYTALGIGGLGVPGRQHRKGVVQNADAA